MMMGAAKRGGQLAQILPVPSKESPRGARGAKGTVAPVRG